MSRWTLQPVPADGDYLVFGLPYAGTGASSFSRWPRRFGAGRFCAVQPPGRENRFGEDTVGSHQEFAEGLAAGIADRLDRPYALIGHCGAVPFLLQTAAHLERQGLPVPQRLFASGWGAPHKGLYGRLNFADLAEVDLVAEIEERCAALGYRLHAEFVEIAAETMLADLRVQRGYRAEALPSRDIPVSVIGWTEDRVVPQDAVWPGWEECADATFHVLEGDHWEFLRCPEALRDLVEHEMSATVSA
ncbi:thioesterase domain-containing protein [Streptomyces sp. NPDC040750]|uniref:thioesterase II family protein n=1 Tax=Streptomyces sp. NPDC040750 TaxID=3154491 RepID=UPI003409269A